MAEGQIDRGNQYAHLGEQLTEPSCPQAPGQQSGEEDGSAAGERRQQPDRKQGIAKQPAIQAQQQDGKRRMVYVPPIEPLATSDVIELIAEEAEPFIRHEMQSHLDQGGYREHGDVELRFRGARGVRWFCVHESPLHTGRPKMRRRWRTVLCLESRVAEGGFWLANSTPGRLPEIVSYAMQAAGSHARVASSTLMSAVPMCLRSH